MRITYNLKFRLAKISFLPSSIKPTYSKHPSEQLILDFDEADNLSGIELLHVPDFSLENIMFKYLTSDITPEFQAENEIYNSEAMPPIRKVPISLTSQQTQLLTSLKRELKISTRTIIISAIEKYSRAKNRLFEDDLKMNAIPFKERLLYKQHENINGVVIWYHKDLKRLFFKLNNRKAAYTKLPSPYVEIDFDADNHPIGIEIKNVDEQIYKPLSIELEYNADFSKNSLRIEKNTALSSQLPYKKKQSLYYLYLSPKQIDLLMDFSLGNEISSLIQDILSKSLFNEIEDT